MMRYRRLGSVISGLAVVCLLLIAAVQSVSATETYDLLFKTGTLDKISRETTLIYQRRVSSGAGDETASHESGTVDLAFAPDDMAVLTFRQGDRHRTIGSFPANVGNPLILYFVESIVRDMAATAGGSPYYIRNRIKAALNQENPVREETLRTGDKTIHVTTVTLHPFADDPNRDRMLGFADLTLTVRMSDEIPGWYYELLAETADAAQTAGNADKAPVYASSIRFQAPEVEE